MIFRGIHRSDRPFSDPGEARTLDPLIKSQLLYQLSYGVIVGFLLLLGKVTAFFLITQIFFAVFLQNIAKTVSNQASTPLPSAL